MKKSTIRGFLTASLTAAFLFILPIHAISQIWKIMPIGDSITRGLQDDDNSGFRDELNSYLLNEGISFDFVGDPSTAPLEGWFLSGAKIEDFLQGGNMDVGPALEQYQPNMVLVHLGTNNMGQAIAPYTSSYTASGKLFQLLSYLSQYNFLSRIIVCKIIPKKDDNGNLMPEVKQFNEQIDLMFFDGLYGNNSGVNWNIITLSDMYNSINPNSDLDTDGIHPVATGYDKMAQEYTRIIKGINNGPESTPPGKINLTGSYKNPLSAFLQWKAVGDDGASGRANLYELRWSENPISTYQDFQNARLRSIPKPKYEGQDEQTVLENLNSNQTYYFRIRAFDEWNNPGEISSEVQVTIIEPNPAVCDSFLTLADWIAADSYTIENGELTNNALDGWGRLAVFTASSYSSDAEHVEASMTWSANSTGADASGIAMLLDNASTNANGYLIYIRDSEINLYQLVNGTPLNKKDNYRTTVQPAPGDLLTVQFIKETGKFEVSVNNNWVGSVSDPGLSLPAGQQLFAGLMIYGSSGNSINNFCLSVPPLPAHRLVKDLASDNQIAAVTDSVKVQVQVVDVNGQGVPNVPVDFSVISGQGTLTDYSGQFDGNIWTEAEDGVRQGPMSVGTDMQASNNKYIYVNGDYWGKGTSSYRIYVPKAGRYKVALRAYAPDGNQNSCWIAVNGDTLPNNDSGWQFNHYGIWAWYSYPADFYLEEGFMDFAIRNREPGTRIDKILITSNLGYTPTDSDKGGGPLALPNISNSEGWAYTMLTFGTTVDTVIVKATAPVPADSVIEYTEYATADAPVVFRAVGSTQFTGKPYLPLDSLFTVELKDQYGNACAGVGVSFEIINDGNASLSKTYVQTDFLGRASTQLTLGSSAETHVVASVPNYPSLTPIDFYGLSNSEDLPYELQLLTADNLPVKVHQTYGEQLKVRILSSAGGGIANSPVIFKVTTGNGKINSTHDSLTVSTDANGDAAVSYTLGDTAGVGKNVVTIIANRSNNSPLKGSPAIFAPTAEPDVANKLVSISGDNQQQTAGQTFEQPLVVKVQDQYGNGIQGISVTFSITQGKGAFSMTSYQSPAVATVATDSLGLASVPYTPDNSIGQHVIQAQSNTSLPGGDTVQFTLSVTEAGPSELVIVDGQDQTGTVKRTLAKPFKVKVLDPFGAPKAGVNIVFKSIAGNGLFGASQISNAVSNAQGIATSQYLTLGQVAGIKNHTIEVSSRDYSGIKAVYFYATANPDAADSLVAVTDRNFQYTAGSGPYAITVQVTDQYGNARSGQTVSFEVTNGDGFIKGSSKATSANDGRATIHYFMGTKATVPNIIKAYSYRLDDGSPLKASPITFTGTVLPDGPEFLRKISGDLQSGTVLTTLADPFVIVVTDTFDNPIPNVAVLFEVREGNGEIIGQAEQLTDQNGNAQVFLRLGNQAGVNNNKVRVSVIDYPEINPVTFQASALAAHPYRITAQGDTLLPDTFVGAELRPQVLVSDSLGNPADGFQVVFRITRGNGKLGPAQKDTVHVLTKNGVAETRWVMGDRPDTNKVRIDAEWNGQPLQGSPVNFKVYAASGAADSLKKISPDTIRGVFGQPLAESDWPTVRIVDNHSNPVTNHPVLFRALQGGTLYDGTNKSKSFTVRTNAQGEAKVGFIPDPLVSIGLLKVESTDDNNNALNGSPAYFWIKGVESTAHSIQILTTPAALDTVGNEILVRVRALDQFSNPVAYHSISFECLDNFSVLLPNVKKTDSRSTGPDGIAEITWRLGTLAHQKNALKISAINGSENLKGSPDTLFVTTIPDIPASDSSVVVAAKATAKAGEEVGVTITMRDKYGNPVSGYTVKLASDEQGWSFTQPTGPTGVNGQTTGMVKSTISGRRTFYASIEALPNFKTRKAALLITPAEPYQMKRITPDNSNGNIGAKMKDSLAVVVQDSFNNSIPGIAVVWEAKNGGSFIFESGARTYNSITDSVGTAFAHPVLAQQNIINFFTATCPSIQDAIRRTKSFQVQPNANPTPFNLTKVSGDSLHAQILDTLQNHLVVRVLDKKNAPIWNLPVRFSANVDSAKFIGSNPARTDYLGEARVLYRMGNAQGEQIVNAAIDGTTLSTQFHLFAEAPEVAYKLILIAGDNQTDTVAQKLDIPLTVQAVDEYGNGIPDIPVIFSLLEGNSHTEIIGPDTINTDSRGYASATIKLGRKAGPYTIAATSDKVQIPSGIKFHLTAVPDRAYKLVKMKGDNQYVTFNRWLVYPIVVGVQDQYDNMVKDLEVSFWPESASGIVKPATVKSDSNGLACTRWKIGSGENNKLSALSWDLWELQNGGDWSIDFSARGVANNFPEFINLPDYIINALVDSTVIQINIEAEDQDTGDVLTYTVSNLPFGARYDDNTHTITWLPRAGQAGRYTIGLRVDDNAVQDPGFDVDSLVINVKNSNNKPVILDYYPTNGVVNPSDSCNILFYVTAIDYDKDPLLINWYLNNDLFATGDSVYFRCEDYPKENYTLKCTVSDGIETVEVFTWNLLTGVELNSFSASSEPYKGVILDWKTANEINNLGFNVLRSESKEGDYEIINSEIIKSREDGDYSFIDSKVISGKRYYYKLEDIDRNGIRTQHGPVMIVVDVPNDFELLQNYPNPFNPQTKIRFQLPKATRTRVTIYNTLGQVVRVLLNKEMQPGYHEVVWDGRNEDGVRVGSGLYYYRLQAGAFHATKKMALLK